MREHRLADLRQDNGMAAAIIRLGRACGYVGNRGFVRKPLSPIGNGGGIDAQELRRGAV